MAALGLKCYILVGKLQNWGRVSVAAELMAGLNKEEAQSGKGKETE